jgi:DDE domain
VHPAVLEDLLPAAWHRTDRYANNRVEADQGRLKSRLRPMRGLKQDRSARVIIAGHAFVQNVPRGHYELAVEVAAGQRLTRRVRRLRLGDLIQRQWAPTSPCLGSSRCNSADGAMLPPLFARPPAEPTEKRRIRYFLVVSSTVATRKIATTEAPLMAFRQTGQNNPIAAT